jgi:hypothetical protein
MDEIRHNGTSLALTKETVESNEIRSDRQIADIRHGNRQVGGDINTELSYGSFDDFIEAVLAGTWDTDGGGVGIDRLEAGVTRRYFSILRDFSDISQEELFTGCEINTFNMVVAPNAIVTGDFGIVGDDASTTPPAGATFNAPTTTSPFDSFTGIINEGGGASSVVTSLTLNVDNGINALFVVGDSSSADTSIARSNVTGSIDVYFEDASLINKFWNETESSIDFTLVDPAGNKYIVTLPRVKYMGGQPDVSGEDPVTISMPFQALYDSSTGTNIRIDRDPI